MRARAAALTGIWLLIEDCSLIIQPGCGRHRRGQEERNQEEVEALEAAELLEVFQWSAEDVWCEEKKDKIREELADVLNYCILMADTCGLDMDEIIQEKVRKNAEKYPDRKSVV